MQSSITEEFSRHTTLRSLSQSVKDFGAYDLGKPLYRDESLHRAIKISPGDVFHEAERRPILIAVEYFESLFHEMAKMFVAPGIKISETRVVH